MFINEIANENYSGVIVTNCFVQSENTSAHIAFGVNDSIQVQQQNCAHQLEIMPNLNAIFSTL